MAYTTIDKSSDYFDTKLYTGNGGTQSITGLDFRPDWVWIKSRSNATEHSQFDAPRGATKMIASSTFEQEQTVANMLTSFNSDGFSLGSYSSQNGNGYSQVSWNWKANGAGSSNTAGSINTTKTSVSTTSGFSISTYTGTGSNATVGHGLGVAPKMIIVKCRSATETDWGVYHASLGNTKNLRLNRTDAVATSSAFWNDTTPTSTVFSLGANGNQNGNGGTYVAYCFAEKQGYSKFSSYIGNGSATLPTFTYLGFKPAFVLIKNTTQADAWFLHDSKRDGFNDDNEYLRPNLTDAESSGTNRIRLLSNGFSVPTTDKSHNVSGNVYIYMAFAENPFVTSTGIPATAR